MINSLSRLPNRFLHSFLFLPLLTLLATTRALAQTATEAAAQATDPEMADALRQSGKIYVVVTAVVIIVAGMLLYLITLDRKVSRLERESKN